MESASLTIFEPLGALPAAYISQIDYSLGQLNVRDAKGNIRSTITAQQVSDGQCDYPKWNVTIVKGNDTSLASDPKVISLIVSYLTLYADPFNGCAELSWRPFAYTIASAVFFVATVGVYKWAKWRFRKLRTYYRGFSVLPIN